MYQIKLEAFEGPLDLLLKLIENQEFDISRVALSEVAEQYLDYLNQIGQRQPDELADFLVVAARLIYIKSKILLPNLKLIEEDDGPDIEQQLKLYKKFIEATKSIEERLKYKKFSFSREKLVCDVDVVFNPPKNITPHSIKDIFIEIIAKIEPVITLPQKSLKRAISIQHKINQLKNLITDSISIGFNDLFEGSQNITEVVVTFLGILELVKQRFITIEQVNMFGEIKIEKLKIGD